MSRSASRAWSSRVRATFVASASPTSPASSGPGAGGHLGMHAVDYHAAERQALVGKLAVEPRRLLDRRGARRGDEEERGAAVAEQGLDALRPLAKTVGHVAERVEEVGQVLQHVDTRGPLEHREHHARAAADQPEAHAARRAEELERARVDEAREPLRGVEEVERVARRRRVEHQQVVAALLVQLVELLHRHVLLRAGHRVRELAVDRVRQDRVAGVGVRARCVRRDRRTCAWRRASSPTARRPRRWARVPRRRAGPGRRDAPRCRARAGRASSPAASPGRS